MTEYWGAELPRRAAVHYRADLSDLAAPVVAHSCGGNPFYITAITQQAAEQGVRLENEEHRMIPPSLNFKQPNPQIPFDDSPFYVNTQLAEWKTDRHPLRAGVSSFGIGGTNAHIVLEEAPRTEASGESRAWQLLLLSAKTASALDMATANLAGHLKKHPWINLADAAYTLQVGRKAFPYRRIFVCQDIADAQAALCTSDPKSVFTNLSKSGERPVVFMFSGQGAQYVNMGLGLYQSEPVFREQIDQCSEILKPLLGLDLRRVLYPEVSCRCFFSGGCIVPDRGPGADDAGTSSGGHARGFAFRKRDNSFFDSGPLAGSGQRTVPVCDFRSE